MDKKTFSYTYQELREKLIEISLGNLQHAALFATTYGAYARVGEIVRNRYHPERKGIKESEIEISPKHLILSVQTEKTGQWRKVPISREKEYWLCDIILRYCKSIRGEVLFPYSTMWAERKFKLYFGSYHIHLLRHWATSHALQGFRTKKPLMPQEVARLGGWIDLNTFYRTYGHFSVRDFIHKI